MLQIDIEELQGASAEECERRRWEANCKVAGRAHEPPGTWERPVRESSQYEKSDAHEDAATAHRPRQPATSDPRLMRDRLEHFRGDGRLRLEPEWP